MKIISPKHLNNANSILPDTLSPDSGYIYETYTDTTSYSDGLDTIYLIDDSLIVSDTLPGDTICGKLASNEVRNLLSQTVNAKIFPIGSIGITPGWIPKSINQELYGINLEGIFNPSSLPNDGTSDYAWDYMVELAPEVLRFPSGESSKFMHLMHDPFGGESIGYGYDIYEIARYFNWSNGDMSDLEAQAIIDGWTIDQEILSTEETQLDDWIMPAYVDNYLKFLEKYNDQLCVSSRYIDDFIEIVQKINDGNPGRPSVKVILSLNIMSETASECKSIADYLRSNGVNVVGVELGNETYAQYYCDVMGFRFFKLHGDDVITNPDNFSGNYWDYINGGNYTDNAESSAHTELFNVLSPAMQVAGAHNFISAFKTGGGYAYKVGIVGKPLGNAYAFRIGEETAGCDVALDECCDPADNWNDDLYSVYGTTIGSNRKFDAVILHNYYAADSWKEIAFKLGISDDCNEANASVLVDKWHFDFFDSRLQEPFNEIIGKGGVPGNGNFQDFFTKKEFPEIAYEPSFDKYNDQLHFDLSNFDPNKKELWVTEWNLKGKLSGYINNPDIADDDFDEEKVLMYDNTFVHGYFLWHYYLKNIKINFDADFRSGFFTYATIQNYAGGVFSNLLTTADPQERIENGKNVCPYKDDCPLDFSCITNPDFNKRNFYMRRTAYFVTLLYSEIFKEDLKYLYSTFHLTKGGNSAPIVFIDPDYTFIYVYFSNLKNTEENYSIDDIYLRNLFTPLPISVDLGEASITYLQGKQLYSTSGKAELYASVLNACYGDHPTDELQEIVSAFNFPLCSGETVLNGCLTAEPNSLGYFKIPITPNYDPRMEEVKEKQISEIELYPNPSSKVIYIVNRTISKYSSAQISVRIIAADGNCVFSENSNWNTAIDINKLPAGVYIVSITDSQFNLFNKTLIINK